MRLKYGFNRIIASSFILCLGITVANAATNLEVTLTDTAIQLKHDSIKAGTIHFNVANTSTALIHEMVILKTDLDEAQLPLRDNGRVNEDKIKSLGEVENIAPGKSKATTLDLTPGRYVVFCNEPGHYKMGMHTVMTVTG